VNTVAPVSERSQLTIDDDFLWGVATAAYQIEGAAAEDGKGPSIWDIFSHIPGKIRDGSNADVACDHYHRWRSDLNLLTELGVNAYRFSVSWPRVLPEGKGQINPKGLDFYSRLVDGLLERGITPMVTLWHADQPQALEELGGWVNPAMVGWFADYAALLFERLGDRVRHWVTLNEPNCFLYQGLGTGGIAPGICDWKQCYQGIHHALMAHGEAVRRFRQSGRPGEIGITMSVDLWKPATESPNDAAAAAYADTQNNWWLLDPLFLGHYPATFLQNLGVNAPDIAPGDCERMAEPCDFLGVNYYWRNIVRAGEQSLGQAAKSDYTSMGGVVDPQGLIEVLKSIDARYGPQVIYITENGLYEDNPPPVDGLCDDPNRVAFLKDHTRALAEAIETGVDVRGYFFWSLMDNFEWSEGYRPRLGLYYTDYVTQQRVPKRSALWYRDYLYHQRGTHETKEIR
jgi:beta-glucosidase